MFFPLGLSNFGWGAWFPFDGWQFTESVVRKGTKIIKSTISYEGNIFLVLGFINKLPFLNSCIFSNAFLSKIKGILFVLTFKDDCKTWPLHDLHCNKLEWFHRNFSLSYFELDLWLIFFHKLSNKVYTMPSFTTIPSGFPKKKKVCLAGSLHTIRYKNIQLK